MSELGFKNNTLVYHGESFLGELFTIPIEDTKFQFPNNEIRIHHISSISERCSPLSLLQTIASSSSSSSIRCKLESNSHVDQHHLINLHASCFYELKTAVVIIGDEEVHLVAMPSKLKKFPCFWCYSVPSGLYASCLGMLNMRCLSIVFDLDETLIVANTMKSFEDRIDMLRSWIVRETDPARVSVRSAELKRYMDDRALLKQYLESDCVVDNGKMLKAQFEEVSSYNPERVIRPVIRLQDRNVVLTRINPEIRDTSVLVRLRPAWEDLRSYLIAKGRKRFEVYVCTMAERDYALEMWRLLDPGAHLIGHKQLLSRVLCVKSGSRKSLLNVFQNGICHPKMAMVIDDRARVWEDKDQPRVHVVPPFTPYYAPQAETANAVPVLCVARNVACNVRGGFFKEFDENFSRRISEFFYEDEVVNLPSAPDVSNYLMSEVYEDGGFLLNGNNNPPMPEGMTGAEVERRWNQSDERNVAGSACPPTENISDLRYDTSLPAEMSAQKPSLLGAPAQRDGMKLGQDLRNQISGDPPILARPPSQASMPLNHYPFYHSSSSSTASGLLSHPSLVKGEEASVGPEWKRQYLPAISQPSEVRLAQNQVSSFGRVLQTEVGKMNSLPSSLSVGVLQEIGKRCSSKVEFRPVISTSKDLQFAVEVLFTGEKIGVGMGKTRKDAQQQAAENALHILADKYVAHVIPHSGVVNKDFDKLSVGKENGILWDVVNPELNKQLSGNGLPKESSLEVTEAAPANTSSTVINQQVQKRVNSPRSPHSIPSKRFKEESFHGSQNLSSSRLQKNGNPIT